MRPAGLIDTGAILSLLNPRDRWHGACVEAFRGLRLPLATTAAVLTEVFHLLGDHSGDAAAAWRLVRSSAITVYPVVDDDLPQLERLMDQYSDRPMDFADATLVQLAAKESLTTVFTIDHADFETYRVPGGRTLRIVPGQ